MADPVTAQGGVPDWPVPPHVKAFFQAVKVVYQHRLGSRSISVTMWVTPLNTWRPTGLCSKNAWVSPCFLQQVHGVEVLDIDAQTPHGQQADACWTAQPGVACTIMVADCLPVLFTNPAGTWVAAAHAGWRGLAGVDGLGVLEATLARCLRSAPADLKAADVQVWLGPCIGPQAFEVGPEVRAALCASAPEAETAFTPHGATRYLADLALLARLRLQRAGVVSIFGNDGTPQWCTHSQTSLFFSHRRDAARLGSTGRMAACIWLERA